MASVLNWRGASGQSYTFQTYVAGMNFYSVGGVYILCRRDPDGRVWALYVGETDSFHDRLNRGKEAHEGYQRALLLGMTHICVLSVSGAVARLNIETDLRHGLRPPANMQGVSR